MQMLLNIKLGKVKYSGERGKRDKVEQVNGLGKEV